MYDPYHFSTRKLILKIVFLVFQSLIYTIIIATLYFRRKSQVIINRSPYLMIFSIFFSFLLMISNTLILFLPDSTDTYSIDDAYLDSISEKAEISFHCSFFNFNSNFTSFFIILCYILRANRLNRIYKIISNDKVSRTKERFYIKFMIITVISSIIIFIIIHDVNFLSDIFEVGYVSCIREKEGLTLEASSIIQIVITFGKMALLSYGISLVFDIHDTFSISNEIFIVLILFLLSYVIKVVFIIILPKKEYYSTIIVTFGLIKALIVLLISGIMTIYNSIWHSKIPICYTVESTQKFSLLLYNEKALNKFLNFLLEKQIDGAKMLIMFIKLEIILDSVKTKQVIRNNQPKDYKKLPKIKVKELYETSLNDVHDLYADIPSNLKPSLNYYIKENSVEIYSYLCNLRNFAYNKLNEEYFFYFEKSEYYEILREELIKEEIIFTRLCQGRDLDYNLTDYEYEFS